MIVSVANEGLKRLQTISDQSECIGAVISQSDYFAFHFIPIN